MKRLTTIITAVLLATLFASAQNGTLDPTNPPDPAALYKLAVTAEPTEAATTSGSGNYAEGTKVTVKATAKTNYSFKYWKQNGQQLSQTSASFKLTMPAADVTLVAVFEFVEPDYNPKNPADPQAVTPEYALYLQADPTGACTFNRTSGAKVKEGTTVSIKATPVTGYTFEGWYDSNGTQLGNNASLSFVMPSSPTTLTARVTYSPSNPNDPSGTQDDVDNVADAVTLTARSYTRQFGEDNPPLEYDVTAGSITSGTPVLSCSATKTSPAGVYDIVIEKGTVSNSKVKLVNGTLTITPVETAGIPINETTFPDENFRNWVLAQSYGQDGVLTEDEIEEITEIEIYNENIASLKGIEYFSTLTNLAFGQNNVSSIDVSQNTALKYLGCSGNSLTSIDVSKNLALEELYCDDNQLTTIDVSKNLALEKLDVNGNQLTSIDISKNTALTSLNCRSNKFTSLDVSKNTALRSLDCAYNQLSSLDLSTNTALDYLLCYNNSLTSLNVSSNTALRILVCYSNKIKGSGMDVLVQSLTSIPESSIQKGHFEVKNISDSNEQNIITKNQVAVAKAKGWNVFAYNEGYMLEEYEGDVFDEVEVTDISAMSDAVYVEPVTALVGGEVQVNICLKNARQATAYVFDLVLPDGITVAQDANGKYIDALSDRHDDHMRIFNFRGNGVYAFSALSGNSEPLAGNDGALRIVTLKVADVAEAKEYPIEIKKAQYSLQDGTLVKMDDTVSKITVANYILGDVNGNGGLDIGDAVSVVNYLVGKPSQNFVEAAADMNQNGQIDIGDAVTIVNVLVGKAINNATQLMETENMREPQ